MISAENNLDNLIKKIFTNEIQQKRVRKGIQ